MACAQRGSDSPEFRITASGPLFVYARGAAMVCVGVVVGCGFWRRLPRRRLSGRSIAGCACNRIDRLGCCALIAVARRQFIFYCCRRRCAARDDRHSLAGAATCLLVVVGIDVFVHRRACAPRPDAMVVCAASGRLRVGECPRQLLAWAGDALYVCDRGMVYELCCECVNQRTGHSEQNSPP